MACAAFWFGNLSLFFGKFNEQEKLIRPFLDKLNACLTGQISTSTNEERFITLKFLYILFSLKNVLDSWVGY